MQLFVLVLTSVFGLSAALPEARAESWPTKPIRAIVPYGAGSTADIVPRTVFEQLAPLLGQSIVVENRPGAGGTTGSSFVAKAEPDGYTLLVNSNAHTISPALYPKLGYDPVRDFASVIPLGISPNVLVVSPTKGFKTVRELVAAAQAKPGTLNFSSVGVGTATHMSAERFLFSAGVKATHVPFKGGAQAMAEVMAGRIDFFFGPVGLVLPHIQSGKLTALAVNSTERSTALPDVPTTRQSGYVDAEYPIWFGLFAPVKTPRAVINTVSGQATKALQSNPLKERLAKMGLDPMMMNPTEFDAHVAKEVALNAALVKAVGIKPD